MPAFKLTEDLFFDEAVHLFEFEREHIKNCNFDGLNEVLNARNAKLQIEALKKVTKILSGRINTDVDTVHVTNSLHILTSFLFVTTRKNPIRRFLKSYFLGLGHTVQDVIHVEICRLLQLMCRLSVNVPDKETKTEKSGNDDKLTNAVVLRHNVDSVACLIENFSLGERCVEEVCQQLLEYLTDVQQAFYDAFCLSGLSPVQHNEVMHHVLENVKLINRICQKSAIAMEMMKSEQYLLNVSKFPHRLLNIDINILQHDCFLLDCKTTCSMNIWLLLKLLASTDILYSLAAGSIFKGVDWLTKSCDFIKTPDWLSTLLCESLSVEMMSDCSYLCCCYGFLAIVAMDTLTHTVNENCLLLDCLLDKFLELSQRCTTTPGKLLAAKSISLLVLRMRDFCNQGDVSSVLTKRFHGNSPDMKKILQFVWTTWEHSVDAIRFTVKDIFENLVTVHLYCSDIPVKEDPFLLQLLNNIMQDVSWSCKGKYPTLSVLVSHLGSTRMLQMQPGIAEEVLTQLQEQTLACYGSELYEKLFTCHKHELKASAGGVNDVSWCEYWLKPVLTVLCGTNKLQKKHTIEYVLPKILNCEPLAMHYIIPQLSKQKQDGNTCQSEVGRLGALIMCLRRARALGQLRDNKRNTRSNSESDNKQSVTSDNSDMWCGVVNITLLQQALVCKDEQIRLDAFALLCENQKTSEVIREVELRLIKSFIPNNLTNQNPAFRQHFLSLIKKFLFRMNESSAALLKKVKKDKSAVTAQTMYKDFLTWFTRCLFNSLYPGSVFARRSTCLEALTLLITNFGSTNKDVSADLQFNIFTEITPSDVNSLIFCITDTFEENKDMAATILIACTKQGATEILNESQCTELLDLGLTLSESTRPQDSMTASYLLSVLIHQQSTINLLKHKLSITDAGNNMVTPINQQNIATSSKEIGKLADGCSNISINNGFNNDKDITMEAKESGDVAIENNESLCNDKGEDWLTSADDSELDRRYILLSILMKSLRQQTEIAKTSLVVAAANKPLYPTIQCMRHCFSDVDFRKIPAEGMAAWRNLLCRFVSLCSEISQVVSPVVCNSSPEGNVPIEALEGMENLGLPGNEDVTKSHETVTLMPEYLIVCCWRSVKEMSLLLGQLTSNVTIATGTGCQGLLNYDEVMIIRDFFQQLLLESKHRGAFELAYAGFVKVTEMLWRNSNPALHELPVQLLSEVMEDIRSNDVNSKLCATRRSAGVPFYVQALVSTEPLSTGRRCFKRTMDELLCLGMDETIITQEQSTAKVHALNILRALFKDSKLRDDVAPYVADGLKVAILGFKSPLWAVRNSATLLMTAMMTRIFGVKRSKDETTFNRKNCQTGRTFFYHYPCLYQFLLDEIVMATEHVTSELHPGLYPILMVLGRLFPSSMEGTDTSLNISAFIPYVIKCCGNPVLKTRVMAAKAIQPLVDKDHVTSVFRELLNLLPCQPADRWNQNQIHGSLLQISKLFETVPTLPVMIQASLSELICEKWSNIMEWLITRNNTCLLTREVTMTLTFNFIRHFEIFSRFIPRFCDTLMMEINDLDTAYDVYMPALSQFQSTICTLWCDINFLTGAGTSTDSNICDDSLVGNCDPDSIEVKQRSQLQSYMNSNTDSKLSDNVILKFLQSRSYEVREIILKKLSLLSNSVDSRVHMSSSHSTVTSNDFEMNPQEGQGEGHNVLTSVIQSEDIQSCLLSMLDKETEEACYIELVSVLGKWWGTFITSGPRNNKRSTLVTVVHSMVTNMNKQKCSDALIADKITFLGTALCRFLSASVNESAAGDNNQTKTDTILQQAIDGFLVIVQGQTSHVETSSNILLACARSLLNFDYILGTSMKRETQYVGPVHVTLVFRSVLDLLQADDIEVRETASAIVHTVTSGESNGIVSHPYVSMTTFLQHWVKHGILSYTGTNLSTLFDIVWENKEDSQDYEERLFDRGEVNTYWDELNFLQRLDEAIHNGTQTSSVEDKEFNIHPPGQDITDPKTGDKTCDSHVDIPTYRTIFLDTHTYQSQVLSVIKECLTYKYRKFIPQSGYNVSQRYGQFTQYLTKIRPEITHNVWPSVIVQYINSIYQ